MLNFANRNKTFILIALFVLGSYLIFSGMKTTEHYDKDGEEISYSKLYEQIKKDEIIVLTQKSGSVNVIGLKMNGDRVNANIPENSDLLEVAREKHIEVRVLPPDKGNPFGTLFIVLLPMLIFIAFLYWMQKRQANEVKKMVKLAGGEDDTKQAIDPDQNPYRLSDVAGCDEAKKEVAEIIDFLKNPDFYARVGARPPKGILMAGPPGTGKTLMAKAIAGEAGVPFFSASGSDFMEMFVGVGAARVRSLFQKAKKSSPAIIFIDEIDSIGTSRGAAGNYGGNDERVQTLNALLTEMDGFTSNIGVVVIAATNRPDILDSALRRPGRFDREVTIPLPDRAGREDILKVHGKNVPIALNVSWAEIAKGTPGFSGADLANLVNEAAILAAREKSLTLTKHHFEEAKDKIIMGAQRSSIKNEDERKTVAIHEAGHAIVAHFTKGAEPIHKISIVPRGSALGVTVQLPKEDSYNHSEEKLLADITVLMGGRAAEDVFLNQRTVGASNDFMRATILARRMIASWGMDPDFGPVSIDGERGNEWVGTDIWSESIKTSVDNKVQKILKEHYEKACNILKEKKSEFDLVVKELMEKETIDSEEFLKCVEQ